MIKKSQAILDIHAAVDLFYAEQEIMSAELAQIKKANKELERKNESLERKNQKLMEVWEKLPGNNSTKFQYVEIIREIMLSPIMDLLDSKYIRVVIVAVSELLSDIGANESRVKAVKVIIDEWVICKTADELLLRIWTLYYANEIVEFDKFGGSFELLFQELNIDIAKLDIYFENQTNKAAAITLTKSLILKTNLFKTENDVVNNTKQYRKNVDFILRLYDNYDTFFCSSDYNTDYLTEDTIIS